MFEGEILNLFLLLEEGITPESMDMEDRFGLTLQKAQPLRVIAMQL